LFFVADPRQASDPLGHFSIVLFYMVLGPMGICYLMWFAALRRLPAATAATGTLSVPIIGVIAAAIMLGEPLGVREALAMALTLASVALAPQRPTSTDAQCRMTHTATNLKQ
jgi:drug/metabolite transporter (DMT)-like permease